MAGPDGHAVGVAGPVAGRGAGDLEGAHYHLPPLQSQGASQSYNQLVFCPLKSDLLPRMKLRLPSEA